jgi:hypothetical protein
MKENIEVMLEYLTSLTREEADFAEHVLLWPHELKSAFMIAKKLLDQKDD